MSDIQNKDPKERILSAALDVVNKKTISGTRMHFIADQAEMVQSNVHYYYRTKNDLMMALQERIFEECYDIRRQEKLHSKKNIESQLDVFINQKKKLIQNKNKYDFAEMDFWIQGQINEEIRMKFSESYEKWRSEIRSMLEEYCPDLDEKSKEMLPYMIVSMLEGATIQYFINKNDFDIDGYFDYCKLMILNQIKSARAD